MPHPATRRKREARRATMLKPADPLVSARPVAPMCNRIYVLVCPDPSLYVLIDRSAWKENSANFAVTAFSLKFGRREDASGSLMVHTQERRDVNARRTP